MTKIKLAFKKDVYLQNFDHYCDKVHPTFSEYFDSIDDFKSFLNGLDKSRRENFLHLAVMYHFLIVKSELKTDGELVGYFDQSYKFLCLISLIESAIGFQHRSFFDWLNKKDHRSIIYPLKWESLETRHKSYLGEFGSQRKFLKFFKELDEPTRELLAETVRVEGNKFPLKELASYLYRLRSEFVHEATPVIQISDTTIFSMTSEGLKETKLTLELLQKVFEHGVLIQFGYDFEAEK